MESVIVLSSLDDIKSYLNATLVTDRSIILPSKFQDETFDFYGRILSGAKEMRARWKRCTDQTDNALPDALGQRFVEKTLGEEGMKRTHEMVAALEKALGKDIQSLDWMTPKTKEAAMVKLHAIMNKVGTKNHWLDYATVHVVRGDAYGNLARADDFELHRQLNKIGKPFDRSDWQMSQPTVNAYYDPQENDINFPAGILQPPFYDNKMDDAVNFGAHRRGDRPRTDARLRRSRAGSSMRRVICATGGRTPTRRRSSSAPTASQKSTQASWDLATPGSTASWNWARTRPITEACASPTWR